jgi:ketosteroid isomerase-like protein
LGAQAAWLGTRFLLAEEMPIHEEYRRRLIAATEADAEWYADLYDVGWPDAPHRAIRNSTAEKWEAAGRPELGSRPGEDDLVAHFASGDPILRYSPAPPMVGTTGEIEALSLWAGQSVALAKQPQPAAEIVAELVSMLPEADLRARIQQHWDASERGDAEAEHAIYAEDAILEYPQSGERFKGRSRIQAQRGGHPAERHFTVRRIVGSGDLWMSECVITYDGAPTDSLSVMEIRDGLVTHETQYFADPFPAPSSRAGLAESAG